MLPGYGQRGGRELRQAAVGERRREHPVLRARRRRGLKAPAGANTCWGQIWRCMLDLPLSACGMRIGLADAAGRPTDRRVVPRTASTPTRRVRRFDIVSFSLGGSCTGRRNRPHEHDNAGARKTGANSFDESRRSVGAPRGTSSTIRATTSSWLSPVVSSVTASAAAAQRRVLAARVALVADRPARRAPSRSRRPARPRDGGRAPPGSAVRNTLTSASGRDHGADVPALGHPVPAGQQPALLRPPSPRGPPGPAAAREARLGHLGRADRLGHVPPVEQRPPVAQLDPQLGRDLGRRSRPRSWRPGRRRGTSRPSPGR